jgi:hypothetical protein
MRPIGLVYCNPSLLGYIMKVTPPPPIRACGVSLHGIIPNYRSLPSARFSSARAPSPLVARHRTAWPPSGSSIALPVRLLRPRRALPRCRASCSAPLQVAARPRRFRSRAAILVARRRRQGATPPLHQEAAPPPPGSRLPPSD